MKHFCLLLILLASSCSSVKKEPDELSGKMEMKQDVDNELTIGREMAAKLLGVYPLYDNSSANFYVNLVGESIVEQNGRPELTYHFAVLDTDEKNGFACPGGYIFVTKGLLLSLQSEAELGGVLAHEIAHVNKKHMYDSIKPKRKMEWTETIARLFTHGYGDLGYSLGEIVEQGIRVLTSDGYGKEKEYEADRLGVTYATFTGYDAKAFTKILDRLGGDSKTTILTKTHPSMHERLKNIQTYSEEEGLAKIKVVSNQKVLEKRFAAFESSLGGKK